MRPSEQSAALERLSAAGIREYTREERHQFFIDLRKKISIGIKRTTAPTMTDGGLLAFPTGITPITGADTALIPANTPSITCACGGTNWIFTVARKQADGSVKKEEPFIKPIPEDQRQMPYAGWVSLFADEIMNVVKEYDLIAEPNLPIAISFGFPQTNIRMPNGDVDARLSSRILPKFWQVTDLNESLPPQDQPSLAGMLREALTQRGLKSIGNIVFVNDTVAVALDVQHQSKDRPDLPVGFVFGTGMNAAVVGGEKGIVNLEVGSAEILAADRVLEEMQRRSLVPTLKPQIEYWVGGGFLVGRIAGGVASIADVFTDPEQLIRTMNGSTNQALVSDMAEESSPRQLELHVGPGEYPLVQEMARRTLTAAGQLIGVIIAAVCAEAGYSTGAVYVPYEGSLLAKGHGVQDVALKTVGELLPGSDVKPYKADGVIGVAKLAMVKSLVRSGEVAPAEAVK